MFVIKLGLLTRVSDAGFLFSISVLCFQVLSYCHSIFCNMDKLCVLKSCGGLSVFLSDCRASWCALLPRFCFLCQPAFRLAGRGVA